jgi:hypothetical protein
MSRRPAGTLSVIENGVIQEIRALRASPGEGIHSSLLETPAQMARHFILDSHGNVQLRLATIARELGVEMRTLERTFPRRESVFGVALRYFADCHQRAARAEPNLSFAPSSIEYSATDVTSFQGVDNLLIDVLITDSQTRPDECFRPLAGHRRERWDTVRRTSQALSRRTRTLAAFFPVGAYCGMPISFDSCSRIFCLDSICSSLRRAS